MNEKIMELIHTVPSIAFAGMCKNAGKTTVLNTIIQELNNVDLSIGLTSIGRDGESSDLVTGTEKPTIYIKEGSVIATSSKLLKNCDITKEILISTGINTPLGEIMIIRARSDGYIDLAGPSMNQQLIKIVEIFQKLKVDKVLIDGAVNRKSLCSPDVADSVILCTGATYHRDMEVVIKDTAFVASLLQLKAPKSIQIRKKIESVKNQMAGKFLFLDDEMNIKCPKESESLLDCLRMKEYKDDEYIYLNGACTDSVVKPMFFSNIDLKDKKILVQDSSKILLTRKIYDKLLLQGAAIEVQRETHLLAVTINPFSAYGHHFDKQEFYEGLAQNVNVPVINVKEENH